MEIRDNIIKKWYNINKILIRIFIVWILIIPLGHIIVPYNYYYSTGVHKYYEDLEIIKDKFSINLSDDSHSFFPFRNRQKMSLSIYERNIGDIFLERITIYTGNKKRRKYTKEYLI